MSDTCKQGDEWENSVLRTALGDLEVISPLELLEHDETVAPAVRAAVGR